MRKLWSFVERLNLKSEAKTNLYVGLLIFINIVLGGAAWMLFGRLLLPGMDWLFCFMAYPAAFVGFFGGEIYIFNHEFT